MLHRNKQPNKHRWNGVGGKLQEGETPLACIQREMLEETDIDIREVQSVRFTGIVTWNIGADITSPSTGMYVFLAELPAGYQIFQEIQHMLEGELCWKPLQWACDPRNTEVVSNIPRFLPHMLSTSEPHEYRCRYENEQLVEMTVLSLNEYL